MKKIILLLLVILFPCMLCMASGEKYGKRTPEKSIRPDSTVYAMLGQTISDVLFNPNRVTCYTLKGKEEIEHDEFQVEPHWVRDNYVGRLSPQMVGVLQFALIANSENYKNDELLIKAPYFPTLEFEFQKKKVFKAYLLRFCDMDNDGEITIWDAEHTYLIDCSKVDNWNIFVGSTSPIYSLEGIGAFINLKKLICSGNEIRQLDLSHNTFLETLEVDDCGLKMLNINENKQLKRLSCKNNGLYSLDLSNNPNLSFLDVSKNKLDNVSVNQTPKLKELYCANNELTSLIASNNSELTIVDCSNNKLTSLDLSNTAVDSIMCQNNSLTYIDLRNERNISYLDCTKNKKLEKVLLSVDRFVVTDKNNTLRKQFLIQ